MLIELTPETTTTRGVYEKVVAKIRKIEEKNKMMRF